MNVVVTEKKNGAKAAKFVFDQDVLAHGKAPGSRATGAPLTPIYESDAGVEADGPRERSIVSLARLLEVEPEQIESPRFGTGAGKAGNVIKVDFAATDSHVAADAGQGFSPVEQRPEKKRRAKDRTNDPRAFGKLVKLPDENVAAAGRVRMRKIQKAVCAAFGVAREDLVGRCEKRLTVRARVASMALCHQHTGLRVSEIGKAHRRDRAVVSRAIKKYARLKREGAFGAAVAGVEVGVMKMAA